MFKHTGGTRVTSGFYWNRESWSITTMPRGGGILPGGREVRYVRVPVLVLLGLAPIMGGLYVMFLPFIGFAMVLGVGGRRLLTALENAAMGLVATVAPAWRPGEAYFAGKHRVAKKSAGETASEEKTPKSA